MALARDTSITAEAQANASAGRFAPSAQAGVWSIDGDALLHADRDGPATVLVPTEAVRLIAVDLPLANRAKRLAALPFAVEDMIAEPIDSVHLAIGAEIAPKRYLVGVVRHDRMAEWIVRIEDAGLDHAALVPDALALPRPAEGEWAVDLGAARAVVRSGDGTGFAIPAPMLRTAWDASGRPPAIAYGAALPGDMAATTDDITIDPLGRRLLSPALDLRQGLYARRRRAAPGVARRLAMIVGFGVLAHTGIAAADTLLLQRIADRRVEETRTLVAAMVPGANLGSDDLAGDVAEMLPSPGAAKRGDDPFLPAATRISSALAPLTGQVPVKAMTFSGGVLTIAIDSTDPALATRINAALRDAGVQATVAAGADGIRITAGAA
jgi:general secretion pathway protein L